MEVIDKLFSLEKINGADRCPTYLYRWTLFKLLGRGVYLHHFIGDDWSLDLHDHPKRFISLGIKGRYVENYEEANGTRNARMWTAPWLRSFPARHKHRLCIMPGEDCWTLVYVGKSERGWGFWHDGIYIPFRDYIGSKLADKMKACP